MSWIILLLHSTMADSSPFLSGILSPHGGLNSGATLLSPDETPSSALFKKLHSQDVHTPAPSSYAFLVSTQRNKKRQRDDTPMTEKKKPARKEVYRVVPGKHQLQPYVVCLIEEVISQQSVDALKYPLPPYLPHTEPEDKRKMRRHLQNRFLPAGKEISKLVEFTRKLLDSWGARLEQVSESTVVGSRYGKNLLQLVTPMRRASPLGKLDDIETEDLLQLDFLDDESGFGEHTFDSSTVEDNWTCGPTNLRRVTYHETPATAKKSKRSTPTKSKTKKAKSSNPKRGMRWTTAERKLFLQGLERWGAGNWKSIHKIIPGR